MTASVVAVVAAMVEEDWDEVDRLVADLLPEEQVLTTSLLVDTSLVVLRGKVPDIMRENPR